MTTKFNLLIAAAMLLVITGCDSNSNSAFIDPAISGGGGGGGGGGVGGGGGGGGSGVEPQVIFAPDHNTPIGEVLMSGNGSRISFVEDSDLLGTNPSANWQIWSYDVNGDRPVQLTPDRTADVMQLTKIDASDNGDFIVFIANDDLAGSNPTNQRNVFRAAADGTSITQVTDLVGPQGAREAVVSGDGSLIVLESDGDLTGGNPGLVGQIFTINADGTNLTQITNGNLAPQQISVSDDGTLIAFHSQSDPFSFNADNSREIFTINVDGSNLTQLTVSMNDSWGPKLSDDGSLFVFTSNGDHVAGSNADGSSEVYVGRSNGGGFTQISDSTFDSGGLCCSEPENSISGDGAYVVFTSNGNLTGNNTNFGTTIFWASSTGGAVTQLLRPGTVPDSVTSYIAFKPTLNNNGSTVAFTSAGNYTSSQQSGLDKIYTAVRQ